MPTKYAKSAKNIELIERSTSNVIEDDEKIRVDNKPEKSSVSLLLYNLQQPK